MNQDTQMKSRVDDFLRMSGMNIAELADKSGVALNTLRKARRGGPDGIECCTLRTVGQIAAALGVRPRDLIDDCPGE